MKSSLATMEEFWAVVAALILHLTTKSSTHTPTEMPFNRGKESNSAKYWYPANSVDFYLLLLLSSQLFSRGFDLIKKTNIDLQKDWLCHIWAACSLRNVSILDRGQSVSERAAHLTFYCVTGNCHQATNQSDFELVGAIYGSGKHLFSRINRCHIEVINRSGTCFRSFGSILQSSGLDGINFRKALVSQDCWLRSAALEAHRKPRHSLVSVSAVRSEVVKQ